VFIDDSPRNLAAAAALGFRTVLVGTNGKPGPVVDIVLPNLLALPQLMPELWKE
jgi:FMN phosphatase YigB (HAD superfamily)